MDPSLAAAWDTMFAYTNSMALKAVVQLGILDILHKAGPLTTQEIADQLPSKNPNINFLSRILRFLASSKILSFSMAEPACSTNHAGQQKTATSCEEYRYGLTDVARWFVRDNPQSLAPFLIFQLDESFVKPFYSVAQCVLEGASNPFTACHGKELWSFLGENPALRVEVFNPAMSSASTATVVRALSFYHGFKDVHTLVDVGGATGHVLSLIISAYPHIHAINFDLPSVVEAVPKLPGIQYVGGNMLESVPSGDAIHFKSVLHDWDNKICTQILENCYKATPPEGRVIITDVVIDEMNLLMEHPKLAHDMVMLAHTGPGKERTELQWRNLLSSAGFPRIQIYGKHEIGGSVIEAFKA